MTHPIELDDEGATEQYDEIPWSHLVEDLGRPGPSIPLIVGVVLVVGATLGFIAAVVFGGRGATPDATAPPASLALPQITVPVSATSTAPTSLAPLATPTPEIVFSEADLMAVADDHETRAAAVRAEWFVREYFTVDGSGPIGDEIAAVPDDIAPLHGPEVMTYVEWARSTIVDPTGPGDYDVTVAFQLLAAEGEQFVRHPVRAVVVPIAVGPSLETAATGLPRPASLARLSVPPIAVSDQDAPESVIEEAVALARQFGSDATVLRSWLADGTWHIVTNVRYAGAVWPLQIDLRQPGSTP